MATLLTLLAALALAVVHVAGQRLHGLHGLPRNWVLSAGSGVSVAYVAIHLLPEITLVEEHLGLGAAGWIALLVGIVTFYGLELFARRRAGRGSTADGWLHLTSYSAYNAVVGYLLAERAADDVASLVLFTIAMAVHFLVNDHGLREHHAGLYERAGRWVVATGVLLGAVLGRTVHVGEGALGLLVAVLAGSVLLNVFKEELPEDRSSRWTPLAVGAAGYAVLLLLI